MSRLSLTRHFAVIATAAATGCLLFAGTAASQAAGRGRASPALGHWTELGLSQTAPPELWLGPDRRGWVVFSQATTQSKPAHTSLAMMSATGKVGKPSAIIKGCRALPQPTLLPDGKSPLLIFSGQKGTSGGLSAGCVLGATPASPQWKYRLVAIEQLRVLQRRVR